MCSIVCIGMKIKWHCYNWENKTDQFLGASMASNGERFVVSILYSWVWPCPLGSILFMTIFTIPKWHNITQGHHCTSQLRVQDYSLGYRSLDYIGYLWYIKKHLGVSVVYSWVCAYWMLTQNELPCVVSIKKNYIELVSFDLSLFNYATLICVTADHPIKTSPTLRLALVQPLKPFIYMNFQTYMLYCSCMYV